jgi:hypothetical protein
LVSVEVAEEAVFLPTSDVVVALVALAIQARLERLEALEILVILGVLDALEPLEILGALDVLEPRVVRGQKAFKVRREIWERLGKQGVQVPQGLLAKREILEQLVALAPLAHME